MTTTIYDTSSPAADSLGIPPPQQTTTTETKTTNTTATVDKSVIRQIVDEQLREAANEQTTTNKQEDTGTEEIKEDSTPKNLRWLGIIAICATVIMGCFFVLRFVRSKIICTFAPMSFYGIVRCAGVASATPHFCKKLSDCCQNIFRLNSQFAEYMACRIDKYKVS